MSTSLISFPFDLWLLKRILCLDFLLQATLTCGSLVERMTFLEVCFIPTPVMGSCYRSLRQPEVVPLLTILLLTATWMLCFPLKPANTSPLGVLIDLFSRGFHFFSIWGWGLSQSQNLILESFEYILIYFLPDLMIFSFLLLLILLMQSQVLCYIQWALEGLYWEDTESW